jgi:SAM-dependent methyltransferase
MDLGNLPLLAKVKEYRRRAAEIKTYLDQHPDEWPRFQAEVSSSIDAILLDILNFERENINGNEANVYRLKKLFERRFRKYFLHGWITTWSFQKPYGYAGDFKITDSLYQNQATTVGFERLFDNHFLELSVATAVRNRKDDFKKIIRDFVKNKRSDPSQLRIMNLACGPGRDIKELLEEDREGLFSRVTFDCYDADDNALVYSKGLLNGSGRVNFFHENAVRLALKKRIETEFSARYDIIYSTGLFDYLDNRVVIRLVSNLKQLLKEGGIMAISNATDKYSNHSACWMEWIMDWNLFYRTPEEFKRVFLEAGFPQNKIKISFEKQKIWQYCIAEKD